MKRTICLIVSTSFAVCLIACNAAALPEPEQPQEAAVQTSIPTSEPTAEKLSLPDELALVVGESTILDISIEPTDAVIANITFASSDEDVAAVDPSGKVTAIGKGQTVITATTGVLTTQTEVMVLQPVTEIELDMSEALLHTGHAFTLRATCQPLDADVDIALTWSSSDESVATVDQSGVVTAVAAGEATVSVSVDGLYTACVVTVICPPASNHSASPGENNAGAEAPSEMPSADPAPAPAANEASVDLEAAASVGAAYAESLGFAVLRSPGGMSYSLPFFAVAGCDQANANRLVTEMIKHAYDMVTRGGEDPFYPGTPLWIYVANDAVFVAW